MVARALVYRIYHVFVKWPENQVELENIRDTLHAIAGMPALIGIVDGTHIRINRPTLHEEQYINRHNQPSINCSK